MGRITKAVQRLIWREDAEVYGDLIVRGLDAAATVLPPVVLEIVTMREMCEPYHASVPLLTTGPNGMKRGESRTLRASSAPGVSEEVQRRFLLTVTPIAVTLGGMYQGLQGGLIAGVGTAIIGMASNVRMTYHYKLKDADEPFPGEQFYASIDLLDALMLSTWLPLILGVLRGNPPKDASSI